MPKDDQIFLAVVVIVIILLVWSVLFTNGRQEKLHPYWYRTNCFPSAVLNVLEGSWHAVDSGATYTFTSPEVTLTPAEQAIVGRDQATGADLVNAVIQYARTNNLYRAGSQHIRTDPALKDAFQTTSDYIGMRDVGALGSRIMLTIVGGDGATRDIEYQFQFCFMNPRTGQTYLRLYRPSNERVYDLFVSSTEIKLRGEGSGDVLIATRESQS